MCTLRAVARFPRREPAGPEEDMREPEASNETKLPEVATDESGQAVPAAGSGEGEDDEPREEVAARTGSAPDAQAGSS